ncbi:MAG: ABC transporter substrate-binding protein [Chthoniobacterales bacterium]|nr:ABC transporter substrate-binding protein [Chthoniobacterales bacterium]
MINPNHIAFLSLLLLPSFAWADADAETTLREGMDEVLAITDNAAGGRAMADKLQPVLERRISFESMTRRAIGPGWRQFTPAEQKKAAELFTKLIVRNYSNKFTPGEKAEIKYLKGTSPAPGKIEIPTTMIYKGSRYNIIYRMENRGQWLVTDILAEGVSLVANYRAQFDELFKKGGAAAVLDSLEESVARIS